MSAAIRVAFRGSLGNFHLDAAFEAPASGVTAIFGPSGCGKTTVLRCMAGLLRLRDGLCDIDGDVWQDPDGAFLPTHKRPLGYVFQEASLFPHLSVRRNLMFGAPRPLSASRKGGIAFDEVAELLGVTPLLDRSPRNLSGGERQRVAIGRALMSQPKLLLMDEPLSALDRNTKNEILPFLERLRDRLALPILYITHDIAEVDRLADHIVLMRKGRVVVAGPLAVIQNDPSLPLGRARDAAVGLVGQVESYDKEYGLMAIAVRGGRFLVPAQENPVGARRRIRVVAGDISLTRARPGASSILNVLSARILAHGVVETNEIVVSIGLGEDGQGERLLARLTRKSWEGLGLSDGLPVYAQVKAVALAPGRGEPPPRLGVRDNDSGRA